MNRFDERIREQLEMPTLPIIDFVDCLIGRGQELRASDIHIDPTETDIRIRFRVDGILSEGYRIKKKYHSQIISRIKILASLRSDEHYLPKDGRFRINIERTSFDVRVSTIPTHHGENAVLRLLTGRTDKHSLEDIGYCVKDKDSIRQAISATSGLIIIAGPTGSGKTTTLYSLLSELNSPEVSIVTIEDPIEYSLPGIRQIQVNRTSGLIFATALRSIMRQDPNIIMLGEIRDSETAALAINAALTGHLVLTTIHTATASAVPARLFDMGVAPYLAASTLRLIISQRLVRKNCPKCSADKLTSDGLLFKEGCGCQFCNNTGYSGRSVVAEVMTIGPDMQKIISEQIPQNVIETVARKQGMTTMREDADAKIKAGITTVSEIFRVMQD